MTFFYPPKTENPLPVRGQVYCRLHAHGIRNWLLFWSWWRAHHVTILHAWLVQRLGGKFFTNRNADLQVLRPANQARVGQIIAEICSKICTFVVQSVVRIICQPPQQNLSCAAQEFLEKRRHKSQILGWCLEVRKIIEVRANNRRRGGERGRNTRNIFFVHHFSGHPNVKFYQKRHPYHLKACRSSRRTVRIFQGFWRSPHKLQYQLIGTYDIARYIAVQSCSTSSNLASWVPQSSI